MRREGAPAAGGLGREASRAGGRNWLPGTNGRLAAPEKTVRGQRMNGKPRNRLRSLRGSVEEVGGRRKVRKGRQDHTTQHLRRPAHSRGSMLKSCRHFYSDPLLDYRVKIVRAV